MSTVDVIIPCYKYGRFLKDCVDSVLTQRGVDVRVLVIDDCSPDDTPEVAAELVAADRRVEYRRHPVNQGNIATYNEGLAWAKADYTVLISADDLLLPGALCRAAALMNAHPEVGMAYGRPVRYLTARPRPEVADPGDVVPWKVWQGDAWLADLCERLGNGIVSPEVVVRTRVQHEIGGYRKELPYSGDIELWARFALRGPIGVIDADQALYRVHGSNMHLGRDFCSVSLLGDRWRAFESAFRWFEARGGDVREHEARARRRIATGAIWSASRLLDEQRAEGDAVGELVRFALNVRPASRFGRPYLGLRARTLFGSWGGRVARALRARRRLAPHGA